MRSLAAAMDFVFREEGGFQRSPADSGNWVGERLVGTKYGISARSHPTVDIEHLTRDQATRIYEEDYWLAARCDRLPPALALIHFDAAVNQGVGRAAKILQRAVLVADDGIIGPLTLRAAAERDVELSLRDYAIERLVAYLMTIERNHALAAYGYSPWGLRVRRARDAALALIHRPGPRAA